MHEETLSIQPDEWERMPGEEARKRLRYITEVFLPALELGDEGILILDQEARIEFANRRAVELTGIPKDRLVGEKFPHLLSEGDRICWLQMYSERVSGKERDRELSGEFNIKAPDGPLTPLRVRVHLADTGGATRTYVFLWKESARTEVEESLRKTNLFLSNIIRSSVDGIMASDIKGRITFFNEYAERMLGYRAEDVVGKMHIGCIYSSPDEAREIMAKIRSPEYGGVGKLTPTQVHLKSKEGEIIPCNLSAAMIYENGKEAATVGIFTDLRERLKMERELEQTHLQLVQSEKMASLGKLAAGVAHEINNPLGGILMYANLIMEETDPDDPRYKDLQLIIEQTLRCKDIVQNLLDFSRQSGKEHVRFNINESIQKVISLFENQAIFHGLEVVMDLDPDLPLLLGNPGLINQVLMNLVVNAADAMEGEGTLTFRSHWDKERNRVVVEVEDTGCGIPEEILSQIFDPFFTTKKVGKGTGLGLSTSYGIVKRHGGELTVRSKVDEGSTFRMELPVPPPGEEEVGD